MTVKYGLTTPNSLGRLCASYNCTEFTADIRFNYHDSGFCDNGGFVYEANFNTRSRSLMQIRLF